ncbi:DUF99 family protein [Halomarina litorea]|uniref:endonuclease dU n=1 Tax=Halomarina litorea TaxID=2961595 RepID=UPI0020C2965E|nr:DUF99 family protein [Halomarina sp. BCD28]
MSPRGRALGVAESYADADRSTVAGAVLRADRALDGLAFSSITVGGSDATDRVADLYDSLGREDVRYLLVAGIAPAWFNLLDLLALHDAVERPVLSVSFEASPGLGDALREQFSGAALDARRAVYERQPPRRPVEVNGETVYVRSVGLDDGEAVAVVRAFTPEGGRPEPLRVARLAARAGDDFRRTSDFGRADDTR